MKHRMCPQNAAGCGATAMKRHNGKLTADGLVSSCQLQDVAQINGFMDCCSLDGVPFNFDCLISFCSCIAVRSQLYA